VTEDQLSESSQARLDAEATLAAEMQRAAALKAELAGLRAAALESGASPAMTELQAQLDTAQATLAAESERAAQLQTQLGETRATLQAQLDTAQVTLAAESERAAQLQTQLGDTRATLQAQLDEAKAELTSEVERTFQLQSQLDEAQATLAVDAERSAQLQKKLESYTADQADLDRAKRELSELQSQLNAMQETETPAASDGDEGRIMELEADVLRLRKEQSEATHRAEQLQQENDRLGEAHNALEARFTSVEAELARKRNEIETLRNNLQVRLATNRFSHLFLESL
jgi:chromosome segregation ATPase